MSDNKDFFKTQTDKVAQACGCKNYAHNRFFVYQVLNNYRSLPCWEWKKAGANQK